MLVAWVTASTAYGLLAVLATFLVGPLEAYLDGFALLLRCRWRPGTPACARRSSASSSLLLAEVRQLVARLREQSLTDELTGVANRRAFSLIAAREIERSRRYAHQLSLAYLDIDGFKAVNDRRGHAVGDRVLVALAGARPRHGALGRHRGAPRRRRVRRPHARDRRRGGLPLADRLREVCSRAAGVGAERLTCSVGVVTFEQPPEDVEELLASADALMYEAKAAGGDDVRQASVGAAQPSPSETRAQVQPLRSRSRRLVRDERSAPPSRLTVPEVLAQDPIVRAARARSDPHETVGEGEHTVAPARLAAVHRPVGLVE